MAAGMLAYISIKNELILGWNKPDLNKVMIWLMFSLDDSFNFKIPIIIECL